MRRTLAGVIVVALVGSVLTGCVTPVSRATLASEYYNIGTAYFDLGQFDKSATYLARAIELAPELDRASYNLARVYIEKQRYADALDLLSELLAEDGTNVLVIETIAYAHYQSGDLADAAEWYDRALEISPTDLDLLENRADVAIEAGDDARARETLGRATELTDKRPTLWLRFARVEARLGDTESAANSYETYLASVQTPEPSALIDYASILEQGEYYADELEILGQVIDSAADRAQKARAQFDRARLLLTVGGDEETGLEELARAVTLGFDDADAVRRLLGDGRLVGRDRVEPILRDAGLLEGSGSPDKAALSDDGAPADTSPASETPPPADAPPAE